MQPTPRVRGIYLLPNLFTTAALFAGFYAIIAAMKHQFDVAAIALLLGIVFDGLDGRVARLTHTQTEFGAQLDSMSDMVCFGVTPALLLYNWSLWDLGKIGWLVAFVYMVCTALRLARFNSQAQNENKRYFQGLATPAAAGWVGAFVWLGAKYNIEATEMAVAVSVLTIVLALLKVSTFRYRSFKDVQMHGKVPFIVILLGMFFIVVISYDPPMVLLALLSVYVLSGPVATLWEVRRKRKTRAGHGKKGS